MISIGHERANKLLILLINACFIIHFLKTDQANRKDHDHVFFTPHRALVLIFLLYAGNLTWKQIFIPFTYNYKCKLWQRNCEYRNDFGETIYPQCSSIDRISDQQSFREISERKYKDAIWNRTKVLKKTEHAKPMENVSTRSSRLRIPSDLANIK